MSNLINAKTAAGVLRLKEAEDKNNQRAYINAVNIGGSQLLRNEYLKLFSVYNVGSFAKALINFNA